MEHLVETPLGSVVYATAFCERRLVPIERRKSYHRPFRCRANGASPVGREKIHHILSVSIDCND
jgi:hypothetical protein